MGTGKPKLETQSRLFLFGILLVAGAGCGYQFAGGAQSLPGNVRTLFIEPFVNRSRAVGLEGDVITALKSEFRGWTRVRVVDRLEEADAVLTGVVHAFDRRVVAVNRNDEVLEYEAAMVVDMSLRRRVPDEVLWQTRGARLAEVYSASRGAVVTSSSEFKAGTLNPSDVHRFTDIQLTESLGLAARERLAERFARELRQRLLERF